ncbi:MAG: HlyC/CorC family transporter [Clostridiaceae bacterium]|nr:HlyC/CorC family transporter [Clostridiaceae bacterium]
MDSLINLVIVFLLVFMNAFFVATEFAMVKVRKTRIETLTLEGNLSAKYTRKVVNHLNSYLSACQLGITLASLGLGWIGEPALADILTPLLSYFNMSELTVHSISFVLGFSIITAFHIIFGELVPKSMAILSAEKIALATALPLIIFYKVTYPVMWLFNHSTSLILSLFGFSQVEEHDAAHTDAEIMLLVEDSYKHGLIDKTELTFVDNIFDFSEKVVREIMIPRTDMIVFFKEDSFDEILEVAMKEELTRYPICESSKDNIIGFVHIKDLYKQKIQGNDLKIESIIRNVISIPETTSISTLFKKFQKEKAQLAVVIDEYGGTAGLVTVEDILEEIVGEIQDEFDDEGAPIEKTENGGYSIDGRVLIEDINELLDIELKLDDIDTIGGWLYSKLETPPQINQKIQYEEYEFVITKCSKQRIIKLSINLINKDK